MTSNNVQSLRSKFWKESKQEQCERCLDWERRGLSSSCPTCDMIRCETYERLCEQADITP